MREPKPCPECDFRIGHWVGCKYANWCTAEEAERTAEVEAQYAADAIHGRPIEID